MNVFDVPITPSDPRNNSHQPLMPQPKAYFYIQKWIPFAVKGFPLIKDASLLPADKSTLLEAFDVQMNYMQTLADEHESIEEYHTAKKIQGDLMIMFNNRLILETFINIQDADKEAVKYFNQFSSHKEIPEARQKEFSTLMRKYERLSFEERSDER